MAALLKVARQPGGRVMVTEAEVRECLRVDVLASTPSAEAVYEFWVPQSNERADVAVIGSTIDAFEIKTERDTLKRLPRQADAYTRVFDRCHAVLATRHVETALEILPPWWGVQMIDEGLSFATLRPAEHNNAVDPETLVRLLWRGEAYAALCELGTPPDPRAGRFRLWETLLTALDLEGLKSVVRQALRRRDPSRARIPSRRFTSPLT
jgi:hypothetical protein